VIRSIFLFWEQLKKEKEVWFCLWQDSRCFTLWII